MNAGAQYENSIQFFVAGEDVGTAFSLVKKMKRLSDKDNSIGFGKKTFTNKQKELIDTWYKTSEQAKELINNVVNNENDQ